MPMNYTIDTIAALRVDLRIHIFEIMLKMGGMNYV